MTNDLRDAVRGRVLLPGDDGFEEAALAWNRAVPQPAAAVVEAADADDVAALVRYARREGLTVAAQPSGHGASGDVDGVILLRTGRLDEVEIVPDRRLARVGAGVAWGRVQAAAGPYGLTGAAGSSPIVSVAGYVLGGGLSWFSRRHGWAAGGVQAFEIVNAEGEQVRVTADADPELFWALRGGGGDVALVTALEIELYPAPSLYGGRVLWPGEHTAEVFAAFRELTETAPPELSLWVSRLRFPQAPPMVALDAAYLGEPDEARALLSRIDKIGDPIADKRGPLAVADLGDITTDPTDPAPTRARSELLADLDDATLGALLDGVIDPLINVQIRHLGGALADEADHAAGALAEPYLLYTLGLALNPELSAAVGAKQAEIVAALGDRVSGRKPYTLLGRGETAAAAFPAATLDRLRAVKRARDPLGVFRANFPVLA